MTFADFGLPAELLRAIDKVGYAQPTPIQAQAIPVVLEGRDVLAAAQTGTGKTAGFTLPILARLHGAAPRRAPRPVPRVLVLVPTRELAAQVEENVRLYGQFLPFRSVTIFGGVGMLNQINALKAGVDIIVATPGRLMDHMGQKNVDLGSIETLVLDEADRMLDMGFIHDIRRIVNQLPKQRQTLLFSATFSKEIRELAGQFLKDPVSVDVAPRNTATETVAQTVHPVDKDKKFTVLTHLIDRHALDQVLVFTASKHRADRLSRQLEKSGYAAAALHGDKSQNARTRALADFKAGRLRALVATDIAARGIDIDELPTVINYELPKTAEDYVHRIGRTGRAGRSGQAISLVCEDEKKQLAAIHKLIGKAIPQEVLAGFEPTPGLAPAAPVPARPPRQPRPQGAEAGRPGGQRRRGGRGGQSARTEGGRRP